MKKFSTILITDDYFSTFIIISPLLSFHKSVFPKSCFCYSTSLFKNPHCFSNVHWSPNSFPQHPSLTVTIAQHEHRSQTIETAHFWIRTLLNTTLFSWWALSFLISLSYSNFIHQNPYWFFKLTNCYIISYFGSSTYKQVT